MGKLNDHVLDINYDEEVKKISNLFVETISRKFRRRGAVVAVSGGIDSSVCAALAVEALGPNKVVALMLPERDSSSRSGTIASLLIDKLGVKSITENLSPTLEAIGCYKWRDDAIKGVFPEYDGTWRNKIIISGGVEGRFNTFKLVVETPSDGLVEKRLPYQQYLQLVAATNYKQRIRKTIEYFHADRLNYAVVGTPNRLEYDQGFFVKNGDGSADIKPIAHLYKTQVYGMAKHLGLPEEVCSVTPTTDTYSLPQGQDEFYFALPYEKMDIALWAYINKVPAQELADYFGIDGSHAEYIYTDIEAKRQTAKYLGSRPVLIGDINL